MLWQQKSINEFNNYYTRLPVQYFVDRLELHVLLALLFISPRFLIVVHSLSMEEKILSLSWLKLGAVQMQFENFQQSHTYIHTYS